MRPVGQHLQLARLDLGAVLRALQVAQFGLDPVQRAVQPLGLGVEAVDQSPDEAFALVGHLGAVGAQAFGGKVDDLMHDAGQVRVRERCLKVRQVERVAGVAVGVLIAAHLVFLAAGAALREGQLAVRAGLDPVRGFPQGPVVELVGSGGGAVEGGGFAGHGGCRCGVHGLAVVVAVVGGLDVLDGGHVALLRDRFHVRGRSPM